MPPLDELPIFGISHLCLLSMPITNCNEAGPVKRMCTQSTRLSLVQRAQARFADGVGGLELFVEAAVVQRAHPDAGGLIFDGPQAHDDGMGSGDLKCAAEAEDSLACLDLAKTGVARGEHGPISAL